MVYGRRAEPDRAAWHWHLRGLFDSTCPVYPGNCRVSVARPVEPGSSQCGVSWENDFASVPGRVFYYDLCRRAEAADGRGFYEHTISS